MASSKRAYRPTKLTTECRYTQLASLTALRGCDTRAETRTKRTGEISLDPSSTRLNIYALRDGRARENSIESTATDNCPRRFNWRSVDLAFSNWSR